MKFAYEGYDRGGKPCAGVVEASDLAEARADLQGRGVFVTTIAEGTRAKRSGARSAAAGKTPSREAKSGRAKLENVARFTRELSVLVSTGTPLADALAALERQEKDAAWLAVVKDLRQSVEEGSSLSIAMGSKPGLFDPVVRSLVAAGEESGELDTMLLRLATVVRQQLATRRAIVGALAYPAVLMSMSLIVVVVILMMVVPRFAGMFESLDAPIPASTEMLVTLGTFLNSYWWAVFPGIAAVGVGVGLWSVSGTGRTNVDRVLLRLPVFGPVMKKLAAARISRLLGTLLTAHLPMVEALDLLGTSISNHEYRRLIGGASVSVTQGESLATALDEGDLLTPSFLEAVRNGEATGRLGAVLSNLAEHLDDDNKAALGSMTKAIEPLVISLMGVVIGFLAISMFVPLFDLTSAVNPGGG